MKFEINPQSNLEKPPVLYHASKNADIKVFVPRAEKVRDPEEGPRVFATPSRAMASMFIVESDDSWVQSGTINDEPYIVISDEERFRSLDKGGVIYSLPNNTFENDPDKGLRELEWTSKDPVVPIDKEIIQSALDEMLSNGVKVYFVDKETFVRMQNAPDHGVSIIEQLRPYQ